MLQEDAKLTGIYIADDQSQPMQSLESIEAIEGKGLKGDRYFRGSGYYSDGKEGRELTLIAEEALEALKRDHGVNLCPHESRRNLITRGIDLNSLVGKRFSVGSIQLEGVRLCPPCNHLEELTRAGMLRGLARSGGLRAHIINSGMIALGDPVRLIEQD